MAIDDKFLAQFSRRLQEFLLGKLGIGRPNAGARCAAYIAEEPVVVAEDDRPAYAEAIATASEFSRQIVQQATGILREIGVENPGGFLSSLVRSTVDHALSEASPAVPDVPPDLDD